MQKLTAGSGYDYLTRQVAALDSTEKGHTGLAAYYGDAARSQGGGGVRGLSAGTVSPPAGRRALFGWYAPPGGTEAAAARGSGSDRIRLPGGDSARGAIQGLGQRCEPVPGRGGETDRCHQRVGRSARRLAGAGRGSGPGSDRG